MAGELTIAAGRSDRRVLSGFCLAVALLCSLWPAFYNGQPFFFPDTTAYIRGADAGISKLARRTSVWTQALPSASIAAPGAANPGGAHRDDRAVLAGRSVYYGALLYAGHALAGFWPTILFQAGLFLLALGLSLVNLQVSSWPRLAMIAAVLGVVTPAPFFTSFLMPDVFAGLCIIAIANLLAFGKGMRTAQLFAWFVILAMAALFHFSHILIIVALLGPAAIYAWLRRGAFGWTGIGVILLALVAGLAGEGGFDFAVKKLTGVPPIRPPFLMARLIADGPGYIYLQRHCPQAGFRICKFLGRLPDPLSETILWSHDPRKGIFEPADLADKRALSDEQFRFAAAVLRSESLAVLESSAANFLHQLTEFGVDRFNYPDYEKAQYARAVPEPYRSRLAASRAAQGGMPTALVTVLSYLSVLVAAVFLIYRTRGTTAYRSAVNLRFAAILFAGILVNAAICGILSLPDQRYQARVIWLWPALVLMLEFQARSRPLFRQSA